MRLTAALAAAVLVLLFGVFGTPTSARAAGVYAGQVGVNADLGTEEPSELDLVQQAGAPWVRMFASWHLLEPRPGALADAEVEKYRRIAAQLRRRGSKLMLVVLSAPAWASATGREGGPPADPAAYASFMGRLAGRLRGSVAAWELWNEPDAIEFWGAAPSAPDYTRLLRATYPAVKAADPAATVVMGGLTGNNHHFLAAVYSHGGKGSFDVVSVHTDLGCERRAPEQYIRDPDAPISRWSFLGYRTVHRLMVEHGDPRPIWMTELGWSATSAQCVYGAFQAGKLGGVTEAEQDANLTRAYRCLAADPYVGLALWFNLRDREADDARGIRFGLTRLDGSHRPAWDAFGRVVTRAPTAGPPCTPHYVGPHLRVVRGRATRDGVVVTAQVTAELGLARVAVRLDGRTVRRAASADRPKRLSLTLRVPAARLGRGPHVVSVRAVDVARNSERKDLVVGGHARASARG